MSIALVSVGIIKNCAWCHIIQESTVIMIGRGILGDRGPKTVRPTAGDQPMASRSKNGLMS